MSSGTVPKVSFVRCQKCRYIITQIGDVPLEKCDNCGNFLQDGLEESMNRPSINSWNDTVSEDFSDLESRYIGSPASVSSHGGSSKERIGESNRKNRSRISSDSTVKGGNGDASGASSRNRGMCTYQKEASMDSDALSCVNTTVRGSTSFGSQSSRDSYQDINIDNQSVYCSFSQHARLRNPEHDSGELLDEPNELVGLEVQSGVSDQRSATKEDVKQQSQLISYEPGYPRTNAASVRGKTREECTYPQPSFQEGYCCLHCRPETCRPFERLRKGICCKNGTCRTCNHSCCHTSAASPMWYLSARKPSCCHINHMGNLRHGENKETLKCHARPVLGAIGFIICYSCRVVLQMPENFDFSRKKNNYLWCGFCSEKISYSLRGGRHIFPNIDSSRKTKSTGNSAQNMSEHNLHKLMGYFSASDMLNQRSRRIYRQ